MKQIRTYVLKCKIINSHYWFQHSDSHTYAVIFLCNKMRLKRTFVFSPTFLSTMSRQPILKFDDCRQWQSYLWTALIIFCTYLIKTLIFRVIWGTAWHSGLFVHFTLGIMGGLWLWYKGTLVQFLVEPPNIFTSVLAPLLQLGQVQWMAKTSQSVPIRVTPDCLYTSH